MSHSSEFKSLRLLIIKVDNIVILKLVKTKTNSKYLIGIKINETVRALVLVMPKMDGYLNMFKVKEGDKDKNSK